MSNILISAAWDGSEFKYDDNCPVCEVMKTADKMSRGLNEHELDAAFAESRRRGYLVGTIFSDLE